MKPDIQPCRKRLRMKGYDYSLAGAYFITVCTHQRQMLFGYAEDGFMHVNRFGKIVKRCWRDLPNHYKHIELDAFMVMPDHVHGIIVIKDRVMDGVRHGLPEIVRAFKSFSARRINNARKIAGVHVWQRSYYEHIIRDERAWQRIREYILTNPQNWNRDKNYPNARPR